MGSPAATRWQPNQQLLTQRLRRGWSLEDVVRELCDLADRVGERPLGVNPTMVYNWEKGRHRPRPPYPRLLCLLYECSAEELGLYQPAGIGELHRAGGLVVPSRGFAGRRPERPVRISEATVHNLESVTAAYRRMYHTVAAHDLIDDVAQHAQTTAGFWRRTADPELRRSLAAAASEITMLAGRMSFFDLGRPSQAEPYYQDALEAAQEAQDRPLQAVVLGNKSFLPRSRGDFATALQLLDQAKRLVPDDPVVRSWATALEAMTQAWAHQPAESLVALEAAETILDDATPAAAPSWFDYYDRSRLAGFKGQVHIRLAQPDTAHAVLEEAIGALDPDAAKQRACYLADQATVCVDEGEVDQACQLGIQALQLLGAVEYETGVQRVRDLRAKLRPWRNHPAVADLTEQLLLVS
ncbi:MAG TPA: helix-turn-helix transcriptional regulator [Actinomycetes bacterium]|nr:helix-turn-helix transcriptional regulator [Actinomycetes bacterium]